MLSLFPHTHNRKKFALIGFTGITEVLTCKNSNSKIFRPYDMWKGYTFFDNGLKKNVKENKLEETPRVPIMEKISTLKSLNTSSTSFSKDGVCGHKLSFRNVIDCNTEIKHFNPRGSNFQSKIPPLKIKFR